MRSINEKREHINKNNINNINKNNINNNNNNNNKRSFHKITGNLILLKKVK